MGCFIIKVNGSLRVDSGKHYLGSLSFGGFECVSDNAVPGNYNYDNCGFIASGNYTHIVEGDLILNNEFKAIPYALYVVSGGVSWSEDPTVELTFAMGYIGAFYILLITFHC